MIKNKTSEIIITPKKSSQNYWKEMWKYRELLLFLSWKEIIIKYKQTVIGILWAVFRPVISMIILSIIFGKLAKLPSGGIPYPILVYSAMLPWNFFTNSLTRCSESLVVNSALLKKVYFPRFLLPMSTVTAVFVDFFLALIILGILMIFYRFIPSYYLILLPVYILQVNILSIGLGSFFATLNVKYRDVKVIIPFLIRIGLYISPVGFSSSVIPEKWKLLYYLNPMVGIIEGFRFSILGKNTTINFIQQIISVSLTIIIFLIGLLYFRKTEKDFADII